MDYIIAIIIQGIILFYLIKFIQNIFGKEKKYGEMIENINEKVERIEKELKEIKKEDK